MKLFRNFPPHLPIALGQDSAGTASDHSPYITAKRVTLGHPGFLLQLVISTGATIVAFLMSFIRQNIHSRDNLAPASLEQKTRLVKTGRIKQSTSLCSGSVRPRIQENDTAGPSALIDVIGRSVAEDDEMVGGEDLQLALFCLHELLCSGMAGPNERWKWDPGPSATREQIEPAVGHALRAAVELPVLDATYTDGIARTVFVFTAAGTGTSIHQPKDAEPRTWSHADAEGKGQPQKVQHGQRQ